MTKRPIRIGNCSGAIGDGIDQIYELAKSGAVDAITADYLAEFNLAWRAIELQSNPEGGFEPGFLQQLAWHNGDAARLVAQNKIKIVHDGGALNPKGLALATDKYFKSLSITSVKIAWIEGDNVTNEVKEGTVGQLPHLDHEGVLLQKAEVEKLLSANAYTGQAGIVRALEEGADIVICGRCCDASTVMGLATWWHSWKPDQYNELSGSLIAGHLIECGPYVSGGNYCGANEIPEIHNIGFPIAEIASDGTMVITKAEGTNGAITVDTCKGQLLYEIQGPNYLNPDVIAHIEGAKLEQVGKDRVKVMGIVGSAPPNTAKLAICLNGGWQAELFGFAAGLNTDYKFNQMKKGVLGKLNQADFLTISIEKYGVPPPDPKSQKDCTVMFRVFAQAPQKAVLEQIRQALFYNGLQGYCGLHLSMDWRTLEPRIFVRYFPALISPQSQLSLQVHFIGPDRIVRVEGRSEQDCVSRAPKQKSYDFQGTAPAVGRTVRRPLGDLVFARSGDKGGNANVGLWVREESAYYWLRSFMTIRRMKELLGDDWDDKHTIERCEFAHLWAVHFVVKGILQEGVSSSSLLDGLAKSFGEFIRARHVDLPAELVEKEDTRRREAVARAGRGQGRLSSR
ncbi:hypothetical protein F5Y16DRAFT_357485 [Xylariaceae sp. FL0255]|nr:hypothetical protein F5Y16DRAFT_357485 [Xylariaceae sp. FL0255]